MEEKMRKLIAKLTAENKKISTMESCTGGGLVNAITNIEGASEVLNFSAVTYSNEYKIKMGVEAYVIDKYTVYSVETAEAMAEAISKFTDSDYGIGITGKLNRFDKNNLSGNDNEVFVSIYIKETGSYDTFSLKVTKTSRKENKLMVIEEIINHMANC